MKRIVVAESSPTIKNVADNLLRQNGYNVICTSDGLQAWEVIRSEKPDLVLVGLNLSGITGLELCRQMAGDSVAGGIPVVVMVGSKDNVPEDDLISSGVRGRLKKPFSPRDLLTVVQKMIGEGDKAEIATATGKNLKGTSYDAQVISTTRHLDGSRKEVYNLDWVDLSEPGSGKTDVSSDNEGINAPGEDDEISINHDQFDLAALNAGDDEPAAPPRDSTDEDYDWFIGEMKKGGEGEKDGGDRKDLKDKKERAKAKKKEPVGQALQPDGKDLKFEDFGPPDARKPQPERRSASQTAVSDSPKSKASEAVAGELTDEQLSLIADRVAGKLAASLAAGIDRQTILEAIKSVLKEQKA